MSLDPMDERRLMDEPSREGIALGQRLKDYLADEMARAMEGKRANATQLRQRTTGFISLLNSELCIRDKLIIMREYHANWIGPWEWKP